MSLNETVRAALIAAGHTPYEEVTAGHRIGETRSGFVVLTSSDGKTLIRIRPGDDWIELAEKARRKQDLSTVAGAEYGLITDFTVAYSTTLKNLDYLMGKRNTRTLVILDAPENR